MNLLRFEFDFPVCKNLRHIHGRMHAHRIPAREKAANARIWVLLDCRAILLRDDRTAAYPSLRTKLDEVICRAQNLNIMVDGVDAIPVCTQLLHDVQKPVDVRRMKPNGRLVEHIEYARRPISYGARKLHPLTFAHGEGRRGTVEREIAEPHIHEARRRMMKRLTDALCHRRHILRHGARHIAHPRTEFRERHRADIASERSQRRGARAASERRVP